MVEIKKLLEQIVKDLGVFPKNVDRKRQPKYPFTTYHISNPVTKVTEQGIYTCEGDNTYQVTQPQMVLSISSYSDNEIEALDKAREVYHYFKHTNDLDEVNATVVTITPVANRTALIADHYEYQYGFDVFIRYVDKIAKENYTIEDGSVNILNA